VKKLGTLRQTKQDMDLEAVLLLGGWLSWVISDLPSVLVLVVAWFVAVRIRWRDL
jgi:hypothetical protein